MILEYHRPKTIDEATRLLSRVQPKTIPIGGGTSINHLSKQDVAVVDLQELGLNVIEPQANGSGWQVGAMVRLADLMHSNVLPESVKEALRLEFSSNQRNMATVGGVCAGRDARSALLTCLVTMGCLVTLSAGSEPVSLADLVGGAKFLQAGQFIQMVHFPNQEQVMVNCIARSPADRPVLIVAIARRSGEFHIGLGGFGDRPQLVYHGSDRPAALHAVHVACEGASDDWAGADYRQDVAVSSVRQLLDMMQ
ncbi:MAG: FAD binding domain-containing protein [Anaerolineae bacterium]|nr:FAD binding domain-containing protein [Anaerolineae bacterium]